MERAVPESAATGNEVPVILDIGVSLDGFVATNDGDPGKIHDWMFDRRTAADEVFTQAIMDRGAVIMGRNTFDLCYYGKAWDGPAWPSPTFVVTQKEREPLDWDGVTYSFVSGLETALSAAKAASDGRPVQIMGGGKLAAAYIASGMPDEIRIHIAPVIIGSGIPLFASGNAGTGPEHITEFDVVDSVQTPAATHLVLKSRRI
jgi:dihydrofolate reductase